MIISGLGGQEQRSSLYLHFCVCICMHMCECVCICMHSCVCMSTYTHIYAYVCIYVCICVYVFLYVCACKHIYVCVCLYVCIKIHMCSFSSSLSWSFYPLKTLETIKTQLQSLSYFCGTVSKSSLIPKGWAFAFLLPSLCDQSNSLSLLLYFL